MAIVTPPGAFVDPELEDGYAPFGIQTIGNRIFVSYAKQDEAAEDEIAGQGRGFVDAYDLQGNLLARVAAARPTRRAVGPRARAGEVRPLRRRSARRQLRRRPDQRVSRREDGGSSTAARSRDADGKKLAIDGLWALEFGNAGNNGTPNQLFFTAGPEDETHGLFGTITAG